LLPFAGSKLATNFDDQFASRKGEAIFNFKELSPTSTSHFVALFLRDWRLRDKVFDYQGWVRPSIVRCLISTVGKSLFERTTQEIALSSRQSLKLVHPLLRQLGRSVFLKTSPALNLPTGSELTQSSLKSYELFWVLKS